MRRTVVLRRIDATTSAVRYAERDEGQPLTIEVLEVHRCVLEGRALERIAVTLTDEDGDGE